MLDIFRRHLARQENERDLPDEELLSWSNLEDTGLVGSSPWITTRLYSSIVLVKSSLCDKISAVIRIKLCKFKL